MSGTLLRTFNKLKLLNISNVKYSTAPNERIYIEIILKDSFIWPDTRLGELEPQDRRFPLPGFVGTQGQQKMKKKVDKKKANFNADILVEPLKHEHQYNIIQQFIDINTPKKLKEITNDTSLFENFNYSVHECPFLLKHDLQILLRAQGLFNYKLTVINFYQKHSHHSYEELYKQFIESATQICDSLFSAGFWSCYVDPYYNQSYSGHQIYRKQYDIDKLYKNFAVEVSNFGNCRTIHYRNLNTSRFLGCLVTTAPSNHPLIIFFNNRTS